VSPFLSFERFNTYVQRLFSLNIILVFEGYS